MVEQHVDIPTPDGAMNTFIVYPDEGGPHPVVLFYMDAPGKREELHDMARRIASVGYCVLLPNLYYRQRREYTLKERTPECMAEMFGLMNALDRHSTATDTRALLAQVDAIPAADPQRVGAVGYCMSGPFVVWAAVDFAPRLSCIASIHGANMATDAPDSPHRAVERLACESYFACAQTDIWAPPEHIAQLDAGLARCGQPYRIEWYPDTEHGFVFPQRTVYQRQAAERHYHRLFSLFDRRLRVLPPVAGITIRDL